jgi:hypothetical protein
MLLAELVSYSKAQQRQLVVYLQLSEQSACLISILMYVALLS